MIVTILGNNFFHRSIPFDAFYIEESSCKRHLKCTLHARKCTRNAPPLLFILSLAKHRSRKGGVVRYVACTFQWYECFAGPWGGGGGWPGGGWVRADAPHPLLSSLETFTILQPSKSYFIGKLKHYPGKEKHDTYL